MQCHVQDTLLVLVVYVVVRLMHAHLSVFSVVYATTVGVHMLTRPELEHESLRVEGVVRVMMRSVVSMLAVVSLGCVVLAV